MRLLEVSRQCTEDASNAHSRKRRRQRADQDLERRAARVLSPVQMGELTAGRQALEGAELAPGNLHTLEALRDPSRRLRRNFGPRTS